MEKPPIRIFDETFISSNIQLEKLYQQDRPVIMFVKKGSGKSSFKLMRSILMQIQWFYLKQNLFSKSII